MNVFCVYSKNHPRECGIQSDEWIRVKHLNEWRFIWKAIDTCENMVYISLTNMGVEVSSVERI